MGSLDQVLHLHRLNGAKRSSRSNGLAGLNEDLDDGARHRTLHKIDDLRGLTLFFLKTAWLNSL